MASRLRLTSGQKNIGKLFIFLTMALALTGTHGEVSFKGDGFQVYRIADVNNQGESKEFKMWFRTNQPSGMLMMVQRGGGSLALVEIQKGELR